MTSSRQLYRGVTLDFHRADPWRFRVSTGSMFRLHKAYVPAQGWNAETFRLHGAQMVSTMHRVALMIRRKAEPEIARRMRRIIAAQVIETINRVARRGQRSSDELDRKNVFDLNAPMPELPRLTTEVSFSVDEDIWDQALKQAFGDTHQEVLKEMVPPIQSVASQGYSVTNKFLGQQDLAPAKQHLATVSRDIGNRITKINETTRRQIAREIKNSLDNGLGVRETAQALLDRVPDLHHSRVNTIARTELNNAWTKGSIRSFMESPSILACSVIGCAAEEPGWTWRGEPTCNIQDVPVQFLDELVWHPNHQGTLVPSVFRQLIS